MISTAITSTGMRQTQRLAAPPTQNTAPVIEYRCLYTSDLIRKQKRWQDGFLRFHTFNKRIMVYESPSRNFIGDKHWRQESVLEDGDELQLEKPVLVQVGEIIGATETDLTELLDKRRKPAETSIKATVRTPVRETSAATLDLNCNKQSSGQPSRLRPKSLNALLGTPKGPTGRALVPTKSPHEIRNENAISEWESDRSAKRVCTGLERQTTVAFVARSPTQAPTTKDARKSAVEIDAVQAGYQAVKKSVHPTNRSLPIQRVNTLQNIPTKRQCNAEIAEPVLDESGGTMELQANNIGVGRVSGKKGKPLEKSRSERGTKQRFDDQYENGFDMESNGITGFSAKSSRSKPPNEPIEILSDEVMTSTGETQERKVKLKMASRKPRRKLMYRDLLPQDLHPAKISCSDGKTPDQALQGSSASKAQRSLTNYDLTDFHDNEQNQLADRLNRVNGKIQAQPNENNKGLREQTSDEPGLFVSDDDFTALPSESYERSMNPARSSNPESKSNRRQKQQSAPFRVSPERAILKSSPTLHDTSLVLSKMDEIMFPTSGRKDCLLSISSAVNEGCNYHTNKEDGSSPTTSTVPTPNHRRPATPEEVDPITQVPMSPGLPSTSFSSPDIRSENSTASPTAPSRSQDTSMSVQSQPASKPPALPHPTPEIPFPKDPPPPNPPLTTQSPTFSPPNPKSPHQPQPQIPPPAPPARPTAPIFSLSKPPFPAGTTNVPEFDLSILQKPLPAFQAPRPTKPRSRSPLRKTASDTTGLLKPPPSSLGAGESYGAVMEGMGVGERGGRKGGEVGVGTPWSKEAWDLFGCGRDGVECCYEEFKRKEGIM
ncbi:hypothetical protein ACLMJK_002977 [Lecanora helva]